MHVSEGCEIRKYLSAPPGNHKPFSNIFCSGNVAGKVLLLSQCMGSVSIDAEDSTYAVSERELRTSCLMQGLMWMEHPNVN